MEISTNYFMINTEEQEPVFSDWERIRAVVASVREEAAKVIELKRLTLYYENSEIPGRLSRSYKGNILGRDEGTLDLVFRDGRLILITATLKGTTPELQQSITNKHQELDGACRMLYGGPTESPGPGITEWHLQEVVVSLYKGDDKIFITAFNREALSE